MLPSGPAAMYFGSLFGVEYSVIRPAVVILPTLKPSQPVNHRLPSDPTVMPHGVLFAGSEYSVIAPDVLILPILAVPWSVNQRSFSLLGPATMPYGLLPAGSEYSVTVPVVVILPILLVPASVNHRSPSGPVVMASGSLFSGRA